MVKETPSQSPKSPPKRLVFSKTRLEALPRPEAERTYYLDTKCPGLALCITPTGSRTFYYVKKIDRRTVRMRLGTFPDLPVERARKLAQDLDGLRCGGQGPASREAGPASRAHHARPVRPLDGPRQGPQAKLEPRPATIRRLLERLGWPALSTIKKADVTALHARLGEQNGAYQANRVLSLLRAAFNRAEGIGWTGADPAQGIPRFAEESRDRFLRPDELPRFFQALAEEPNPIHQGFFAVCLLTGARRGNVLRMKWADIDVSTAMWRIPQTKAGVPMVVPLSPEVVEVLGKLRAWSTGEWVFPAMRRGKHNPGHLTDPMPAWRRLCKRAGLENLRIHDLRRSLGSWQALTGASLPIIGKSLGHTRQETTAIYARLTLDPVRQSVNAATQAMLAAGGVLPATQPQEGPSDAQ